MLWLHIAINGTLRSGARAVVRELGFFAAPAIWERTYPVDPTPAVFLVTVFSIVLALLGPLFLYLDERYSPRIILLPPRHIPDPYKANYRIDFCVILPKPINSSLNMLIRMGTNTGSHFAIGWIRGNDNHRLFSKQRNYCSVVLYTPDFELPTYPCIDIIIWNVAEDPAVGYPRITEPNGNQVTAEIADMYVTNLATGEKWISIHDYKSTFLGKKALPYGLAPHEVRRVPLKELYVWPPLKTTVFKLLRCHQAFAMFYPPPNSRLRRIDRFLLAMLYIVTSVVATIGFQLYLGIIPPVDINPSVRLLLLNSTIDNVIASNFLQGNKSYLILAILSSLICIPFSVIMRYLYVVEKYLAEKREGSSDMKYEFCSHEIFFPLNVLRVPFMKVLSRPLATLLGVVITGQSQAHMAVNVEEIKHEDLFLTKDKSLKYRWSHPSLVRKRGEGSDLEQKIFDRQTVPAETSPARQSTRFSKYKPAFHDQQWVFERPPLDPAVKLQRQRFKEESRANVMSTRIRIPVIAQQPLLGPTVTQQEGEPQSPGFHESRSSVSTPPSPVPTIFESRRLEGPKDAKTFKFSPKSFDDAGLIRFRPSYQLSPRAPRKSQSAPVVLPSRFQQSHAVVPRRYLSTPSLPSGARSRYPWRSPRGAYFSRPFSPRPYPARSLLRGAFPPRGSYPGGFPPRFPPRQQSVPIYSPHALHELAQNHLARFPPRGSYQNRLPPPRRFHPDYSREQSARFHAPQPRYELSQLPSTFLPDKQPPLEELASQQQESTDLPEGTTQPGKQLKPNYDDIDEETVINELADLFKETNKILKEQGSDKFPENDSDLSKEDSDENDSSEEGSSEEESSKETSSEEELSKETSSEEESSEEQFSDNRSTRILPALDSQSEVKHLRKHDRAAPLKDAQKLLYRPGDSVSSSSSSSTTSDSNKQETLRVYLSDLKKKGVKQNRRENEDRRRKSSHRKRGSRKQSDADQKSKRKSSKKGSKNRNVGPKFTKQFVPSANRLPFPSSRANIDSLFEGEILSSPNMFFPSAGSMQKETGGHANYRLPCGSQGDPRVHHEVVTHLPHREPICFFPITFRSLLSFFVFAGLIILLIYMLWIGQRMNQRSAGEVYEGAFYSVFFTVTVVLFFDGAVGKYGFHEI